jgi:alkaline phosphatase D
MSHTRAVSCPPFRPRRREALLQLLACAGAPAFVRHARADGDARFALGVASGQPRADAVVLWTRLTGAGLPPQAEVQWELAHDEAFTRIAARGREVATADDAHSVHAEPAGLEPAREYWYRFGALGQRSAVGRTRTAPAPDAAVERLDFAIASCQRWDHGHYAAWRDTAAQPPDLVLFLGDYIYEYASPPWALRRHAGGRVRTLDEYRGRYAQYKSDPALQAAHAACPWIVIWDDHEVDNDYAGLQGADLQGGFAEQRAAAYRAWWEHMPVAKALRPLDGSTRIYGRLDWGRLARLHWLDDRQYRDPQACPRPLRGGSNTVGMAECPALADPRRSLLGSAQERWLAEGWSLDRPWNLLAQQTLMARATRDAPADGAGGARVWTDGWDGYPAARERLLRTLAERRVPGAVVLGGDVHAHVVADLRLDFDDEKSPMLAAEFCGTSISSQGPAQARLDALRRLNPHLLHARADQRGSVRFVLTRERLEADLRAVADARDAASSVGSQARFVVQAGRAGVRRA